MLGQRQILHYGSLIKVKSGKELFAFAFTDFFLLTVPSTSLYQRIIKLTPETTLESSKSASSSNLSTSSMQAGNLVAVRSMTPVPYSTPHDHILGLFSKDSKLMFKLYREVIYYTVF